MDHDELAQHLESLQRESCYRVDAILKQSPVEITQRVRFVGDNGAETGPYIRKFIKRGYGIGGAYERIFAAQQRGHRFKYIPDILECYTRDNELVVVMELVRGQTLQDAVYERNPSVQLAQEVFPKLCDAVSELHVEFDPPIIHRDLKPSNIILTGEGLALIDFGISREYNEKADVDTTHFGTREFAPPEQYGFGQTGTYSDVYSLGMVLFFCLTEKIPKAQDRSQAFCNPKIPEPYRQVIEVASALDPARRFASSTALKRAFMTASAEIEHKEQAGQDSPPGIGGAYPPAGFTRQNAVPAAGDGIPGTRGSGNGSGNGNGNGAANGSGIGGAYDNAYGNTNGSGIGGVQRAGDVGGTDGKAGIGGGASGNANGNGGKNTPGKPKRSRSPIVIAIAAIVCLILIGSFAANTRNASTEQTSSNSPASSSQSSQTTSVQQGGLEGKQSDTTTSAATSPASSSSSTGESSESTEEELAADIENKAAPKNGFDPKTNFTIEVAGVQFQLPSYYARNMHTSENGESFFYAETGSSVAMLMTKETVMELPADSAEFDAAKDAFIEDMLNVENLDEVTSSTDYELAGLSARVVTITGSVKGVPIVSKAAFFYDPDSFTLGLIMFGQTNNAQFDYSLDFAKVITSAKRV